MKHPIDPARAVLSLAVRGTLMVLLCAVAIGCVQRVRVESSRPIYAKPTLSLRAKASAHESFIWEWCVDEDGLLLWRCYPTRDHDAPLGWRAGRLSEPRWQESYAMADFPAWQGQFISALAFQWAATGDSQEDRILKAIGALAKCYEVTGVPGLLVRSYVRHDGDTPLPWMRSEDEAREHGKLAQGFWQRGRNGYWFRSGVAGGHHQGTFTALCVLGSLERDGDIQLSPTAQERIRGFFQPLYDRIRGNGYQIIDVDGRVTGFGNIAVHNYNPQYALWHLTLNRAAMLWGVTAPSASLNPEPGAEYDRIRNRYGEVIHRFYEAVVLAMERFEVDHRLFKSNDIHWGHHAWLGLILANGPDSSKHMRDVRRGFEALWRIHDPFNMHNYVIQRAGRIRLNDDEAHAYALSALEWYPLNKFTFEDQETRDTEKWQPIQNRKISTSYAKGKAYRRAKHGEHDRTPRTGTYQCGFDYLLIYWMSEYFETFAPDPASAE